MNMFNHLYVVEIMQKNLGIECKGMNMSSNCKNKLKNYNINNDFKDIEDQHQIVIKNLITKLKIIELKYNCYILKFQTIIFINYF